MTLPHICVLTPTRNRERFLEIQVEALRVQTYPANLITWVIVDSSDGEGWARASALSRNPDRVIYERVAPGTPLGAVRNRTLELALETGADLFVFMDDDDIVSPHRLEITAEAFLANPEFLVAGRSEIDVWLARTGQLVHIADLGEVGDMNHCLEPTLAVRREYVAAGARFKGDDPLARLWRFLDSYTVPLIVLPEPVCIVVDHGANTIPKDVVLTDVDLYYVEGVEFICLDDMVLSGWMTTEQAGRWRRILQNST